MLKLSTAPGADYLVVASWYKGIMILMNKRDYSLTVTSTERAINIGLAAVNHMRSRDQEVCKYYVCSISNKKRNLCCAALTLFTMVTCTGITWASEAQFCQQLRFVIDQSENEFSTLPREDQNKSDKRASAYPFDGVESCVVYSDPEKIAYHCTWNYDWNDETIHDRVQVRYNEQTLQIENCLGADIQPIKDSPVNHPDIYASQLYALPSGQIAFSLKRKSRLKRYLISLRVTKNKR